MSIWIGQCVHTVKCEWKFHLQMSHISCSILNFPVISTVYLEFYASIVRHLLDFKSSFYGFRHAFDFGTFKIVWVKWKTFQRLIRSALHDLNGNFRKKSKSEITIKVDFFLIRSEFNSLFFPYFIECSMSFRFFRMFMLTGYTSSYRRCK